ncbi:MAG: glycosyltransferase [Alphaproteobacteria bacterium]
MRANADAEIGYILKGFPRLSEPFIANEIHLLETMGLKLRLFSIKRGENDKVQPIVSRIRAPLTYLPEVTSVSQCSLREWLRDNLGKFTATHARLFRRRPLTYCRTLGAALSMCWRYRPGPFTKPRKVYIKEFLLAGHIALEVIESGRIRHLHGHFCHGATTVTWFVSRLAGIPFSFTAHAKDIYQRKLNPGDLLERKVKAARFVTTCTGANQRQLARLRPERDIVYTVYHGLDTDYFSPAPREERPDSTPLVLSVGRCVAKKGFPSLITACAALKQAGLDFRCLIVGEEGDQSDLVRRMIDTEGLAGTVVLEDAVTQDKLKGLYERATVFVLPCQVNEDGDRDGIPNVLVEAMAMGVPVTSTTVSGIPELVADGVDGLLVPPRDAAALADAIRRLLLDETLRHELAVSARKKICDGFDSRRTTATLKDLFLKAVGGGDVPAWR